jgi:hypothetical protein
MAQWDVCGAVQVDKLTANQKLDLNLERGRLRDDLQQLRDRLTTLRTSLEREVSLVRTLLLTTLLTWFHLSTSYHCREVCIPVTLRLVPKRFLTGSRPCNHPLREYFSVVHACRCCDFIHEPCSVHPCAGSRVYRSVLETSTVEIGQNLRTQIPECTTSQDLQ